MDAPLEALRRALEEGNLDHVRAAYEALKKAGGATTQIAAEVLHELRQPLLGIKAYAQMIGEEQGARASVNLLLAQVDRMEQIISDFTRLASDKPAPKERISLSHHVRQAERLFRLNPESARVSLEIDCAPDLEIEGNGRLIEQLVLNLLNNARDAMSGLGRLKVVAARESGAPVLYVADWGPGIPAELREKIFEPYVTSKHRGSGLGLAVCRRICEDHKARLTLAASTSLNESPPPATVFRIVFPGGVEKAIPRPRILVVDDESIIRMVFKDLLAREAEVIESETAEEALEILKRGKVDLIVTDKNLPGLSGLDLAQQARKLDSHSRVILMTGYPSLVTAQQAIELGVMDYLLKPFDEIREVRDKIRAALANPLPARPPAKNRRIDVYEDNPAMSRQISEALALLGYEANVMAEPGNATEDSPAAVIVSWDLTARHGREAVQLGRDAGRGAPFVVLAEHLTMDTALESLRGGAVACLPKLLSDVKALSRELQRALKLIA